VKRLTPQSVAIVSSVFLAVVLALAGCLATYISSGKVDWEMTLLIFTLSIPIAYLLFYGVMKYFIYDQINSMYTTIKDFKTTRNYSIDKVRLDEDILKAVRQDVIEWAMARRSEIEQLKKMEQYRREFVGNVSHELKTPIFNIQGYIFTLLDGGLEDEKINRDYLERASRSVERMISIVEDLDIISQMESGVLQPYLESYDIIAQLLELIKSLELKSKSKNIILELEGEQERKVRVNADKSLIRQVLTNLVVNSIKYGKENGETRIRVNEQGGIVKIEVQDNGMGIAENHLPRIFERFYRVDKGRSREHGGTGLGLSIVKHIVEAHQQTIDVKSTQGEGTCFTFTLQAARD
jgi:two-component system, OmpR family, phosphate regulon sensor histidine kinase PhoR